MLAESQEKPLRILMAQMNPTVGNIVKNLKTIQEIIALHQENHDIILFPELALTGYPPEDLLFRAAFFEMIEKALSYIQQQSNTNCHVVIGHPMLRDGKRFNSASIFSKGQLIASYNKQYLPNYGVFDELRYFSKGKSPCLISIREYRIGVCICEDLWHDAPVDILIQQKAQLILCLNASPFEIQKPNFREQLLQKQAKKGIAIIYVNMTGGQDELLFDGQSMAFDKDGHLKTRMPLFKSGVASLTFHNNILKGPVTPLPERIPMLYDALVLGIRDYVCKNHFAGVVLGLSGGIDSALTLALAVDALGANKVRAVMMPSPFTSQMSLDDAKLEADALSVSYEIHPITPIMQTIQEALPINASEQTVTFENIQARIRGLLLMALSNASRYMLLSTGNKSETATGYSTLYGDMAGGFSPLKDVLKTDVYALAHYRNTLKPVIPKRVLTRPPSAELRENQSDEESLLPYAILDQIITLYMECNLDAAAICARGFSKEDVEKTITRILKNEYKRRQSAPGIKLGTRSFGRDWRFPITSGYEDPFLFPTLEKNI